MQNLLKKQNLFSKHLIAIYADLVVSSSYSLWKRKRKRQNITAKATNCNRNGKHLFGCNLVNTRTPPSTGSLFTDSQYPMNAVFIQRKKIPIIITTTVYL